MRQVPQIKAAYDWMVEAYEADVASALDAGNTLAVDHLDETRDTFERGVFVVLFGQFEQSVTERFESARDARETNPDWTSRRGWDVPAYRGRRVPFDTKLALVLDRRVSAHGKVLEAYALRNHCAHGGTSVPVASIDQFVKDLYEWSGLLRG